MSRTHLAVQTVSNIVNDLIREGLVKKGSAESGRRGQPARPLEIEPDVALSIGLSLDQRSVLGCIANLAGRTLVSEEVPVADLTGREAFKLIAQLINRLRNAPSVLPSTVLGIGIAVSGPFGVRSYLMDGPTSAPSWLTNKFVNDLSHDVGVPSAAAFRSIPIWTPRLT